MKGFNFSGNTIEAECGVMGISLAKEAQRRSLSGVEFMIGFPGTIGGNVYMNAGAHGQSTADCFVSCEAFDKETGKIITLTNKELEFGYRKSILSEKNYILISAKFELKPKEQTQIDDIMTRNIEFRKTHQPSLAMPNAGSVFKNPEGDSAGRLLELAGVKTLTCGDAQVFEKHANFIINTNNATSEDISQLMFKMYNAVKEKYTIRLTPEIRFIGEKTAKEQEIWKELLSEK